MTSEEIVKALRCTATPCDEMQDCEHCKFFLREQLDAEMQEKIGREERTNCDVDAVVVAGADLIERLEKEKAALLDALKASVDSCTLCKNFNRPLCDGFCAECDQICRCKECDFKSAWEWKGVEDT